MTRVPDLGDTTSVTSDYPAIVRPGAAYERLSAIPGCGARSAQLGITASLALLVLAYLGNAAWNLLHLRHIDPGSILAAATLPTILTGTVIRPWAEIASAVAFLLIAISSIWTFFRAIKRRPALGSLSILPLPQDSAPTPAPKIRSKTSLPASPATTDATSKSSTSVPAFVFVPRIFISHSSKDNEFGHKLTAKLREVFGEESVWYDSVGGLKGGDRWLRRIVNAIEDCNVALVILSPESMNSQWVHDEIDLVWTQHKIIIPILRHLCDIPKLLAMLQRISFLPDRPFDEALAELRDALEHAEERRAEAESRLRQPTGHKRIKPAGKPRTPPLVGRETEIRQIIEVLQTGKTAGICAVRGMGGIGKTALAATVADQMYADRDTFPGGVAWVDCRDLKNDEGLTRLWTSVASAIGEDIESAQDPSMRLSRLGYLLSERPRTLLVLDNIESTLNVTEVVTHLAISGSTALLLTARQWIASDLDLQIALPPLSQNDSISFLRERLIHTCHMLRFPERPDADDEPHIEGLAAALYGLPLAIAITASTVVRKNLPLTQIIAEIQAERLAWGDFADPQKGLRACFQRSWRTLQPEEQWFFAGLWLITGATVPRAAALSLADAAVDISASYRETQEHGAAQGEQAFRGDQTTIQVLEGISSRASQRRPIPFIRSVISIATRSNVLSKLFARATVTDISPSDIQPISEIQPIDVVRWQELADTRSYKILDAPQPARERLVNVARMDSRNTHNAERVVAAIIEASLIEVGEKDRSGRDRLRLHPFLRDYAHEQFLQLKEDVQLRLGNAMVAYWRTFAKEIAREELGLFELPVDLDGLRGALAWVETHNMPDAADEFRDVLHKFFTVNWSDLRRRANIRVHFNRRSPSD